jgi:hypothetical protein
MSLLFGKRTLRQEVRRFFRQDTEKLPVVSHSFSPVELPNLHIAIEQYTQERLAQVQIIGYTGIQFMQDSLSDLVAHSYFMRAKIGPVQYRMVDVDVDRQMSCVEKGIFLIKTDRGKIAAHLRRDAMFHRGALELEAMSPDEELASAFLTEIRARARKSSVYRGKILSLGCDGNTIHFHRFPQVDRSEIVLPAATMTLLERNTVRFLQHAAALRRSGRSVKRGLLLHGKPGTGKTYTAKWLGQSLPGTTVILMAGEQLGQIKECCQLARMLAPALVIMEDVDLIASERDETQHPFKQISLHQLLNEMDGLESDAEVIFLLTTNRPDVIENAIAMRPGRIDQAVEFPLPDAECRHRLLDLYGRGLTLALDDTDRIISKTEGASPAFIKEMVRKAALVAAEDGSMHDGTLRLTDTHFDVALQELLLGGGELTRNLLGFTPQG